MSRAALDALLWPVWLVSVAANMATGGRPFETLCARAHRCGWWRAAAALDVLALWYERGHCEASAARYAAWRRA